MKRVLFIFIFMLSNCVLADLHYRTDYIDKLGAVTDRENGDFIFLRGFSSAGDCPVQGNYVLARFPAGEMGNRAFSIALAAKFAGKKIYLALADTVKNQNGFCMVQSVSISE